MSKINKRAYTLAEVIVTLVITSFVMTIVMMTLFHDKSRKAKKEQVTAMTLYSNFDRIYHDLLSIKCSDAYNFSTLKDANGDGVVNSDDLSDYIINAYTGEKINSCDKLAVPQNFILDLNATCMDMVSNTIVAVYYDRNCETRVKASEYIGKEEKTYNNTCGYLVYSFEDSKGELGKDTFVYPLLKGTRLNKKRTIN